MIFMKLITVNVSKKLNSFKPTEWNSSLREKKSKSSNKKNIKKTKKEKKLLIGKSKNTLNSYKFKSKKNKIQTGVPKINYLPKEVAL
jgi:hypothetical protein